jgi:predicted transport protein
MPIFRDKDGKLKKLKTVSIDKEKYLQQVLENNLYEALDMHLLASEYPTTFGGRIDTLAVDKDGAPVIIEYKKKHSDSVINQGLSYLKWLQAQKVEFFEMLILKKLKKEIADAIKIDWKHPRVICIAESYNKFDIDTMEVIPMRIELFRYRFYEEGVFSLEPLAVSEQTSKTETGGTEKVVVDLSAETLLNKGSDAVRELFAKIREKIFEIDENIIEEATSVYIAYRVAKNFAEIWILKNKVNIFLRPLEYHDPKNMIEKVSDSYQWIMNRKISLNNADELEYVLTLIEQSYKDIL